MSTLFCCVIIIVQPDQHYDVMSVKSYFHTETTFEGSCSPLLNTILSNFLCIPSIHCLHSHKSIPQISIVRKIERLLTSPQPGDNMMQWCRGVYVHLLVPSKEIYIIIYVYVCNNMQTSL